MVWAVLIFAAILASCDLLFGPGESMGGIPDPPATTYYTVTFDANGGEGTVPSPQKVQQGFSITLPRGDDLTKSGYTFGGWNTKPDGTGINALTFFLPAGNITLYARWNWHAERTEANPMPLTENIWIDDRITSEEGSTGVWYSFDVTAGTTYYVWWNDRKQGDATKTLDVSVSNARYSYGTSQLTYADSGWITPQDFTAESDGTVHINVRPDYPNSAGTFSIVYNTTGIRPAYTVTYSGVYSYYDDVVIVQPGSSITLPGGLDRKWYMLDGWYDDDGNNYSAHSVYTPTGDITLYARWKYDPEPIPLAEKIWTGGSIINDDGRGVQYSFNVVSGKIYYIWWDEKWNESTLGTYLKTLDVIVSAYYSDESKIFEDEYIYSYVSPPDVYGGFLKPRSFTADQDGTVLIRVIPAAVGSTGTFGVVYSAGITRPVYVAFDAKGGSGTVPSYMAVDNGSIILPDGSGLTKSGYYFSGWTTQYDGTGTVYQPGDLFITDDFNLLYALWLTGRDVMSIEITGRPDKLEYFVREGLDITGLEVTLFYRDGTSEPVTITAGDITGFDSSAAGVRTLTITHAGKTANFTVTVNPARVTGVALNKNTLALMASGTETLIAAVAPQDAGNKNVTWTSGNTNVATVDTNGRVTAVAAGTAVITAATEEGDFRAVCDVTVSSNNYLAISFEDFEDLVPEIEGPTIYIFPREGKPSSANLEVVGGELYDSVTWYYRGTPITGVITSNGVTITPSGASLILSCDTGSWLGQYLLTVEAEVGGKRYSKIITFTVKP
jgi:uncharacterized repeat protein (TIGR02543 family)